MQTVNPNRHAASVERTCFELRRAVTIIGGVDDAVYRFGDERSASIGEQFRHNLEIAENFLRGVSNGRIDYGNRAREKRVETDREFAITRFESAAEWLLQLSDDLFEKTELLVRSELDPGVWHPSSGARELEFLLSHTIHHHAIIAEKLRALGLDVEAGFGVAPSTSNFRKLQQTS